MISNSAKRLLRITVICLFISASSAFPRLLLGAGPTEPEAPTFRTTVSEVRVSFFATDQNNRAVNSIGADDFAVVDGDIVVRDFRSLTRSVENALSVVVMVDTSESASPHLHEVIDDVLQLVTQDQVTTEDKVSVIEFGGLQPTLICDGDCRHPAVAQQLLATKAAGPTPFFDALEYSANFISSRKSAGLHSILLVFSDGNDTVSKIAVQDALRSLLSAGALMYAVDLNEVGAGARGNSILQQLADATGGQHFFLNSGTTNVLRVAEDDLRASYVVTYELPTLVTGFHSVRILPKHNSKLRFHCRRGYFYADGPITGGL